VDSWRMKRNLELLNNMELITSLASAKVAGVLLQMCTRAILYG
jgi:hypothetical protein